MTTSAVTVLLVEDDGAVRRAVAEGLELHGFSVEAVATAEEGWRIVRPGTMTPGPSGGPHRTGSAGTAAASARTSFASSGSAAGSAGTAAASTGDPPEVSEGGGHHGAIDVVILDVGLPGMSGIELCERLRASGSELPILVLSARDTVSDRVEGLEAGADDYLVKPFDLTEVVARVHALHRRSIRALGDRTDTLSAAGVTIDPARRTATVGDARLDLTRREFDLLHCLVRNRDVVMARTQLLEDVWGYDFDVDTNVVDVFVGYVRRKLAAAGADSVIRTVRGVGFVIDTARR